MVYEVGEIASFGVESWSQYIHHERDELYDCVTKL